MLKVVRSVQLDRVEGVYLTILRVAVLAVATICLIAAAGFAIDGLWRLMVPTEVRQEATVVTPTEVSTALRAAPTPKPAETDSGISAAVRANHAAFVRDAFPAYYEVYRKASETYKKPEDKTLSPAELLSALGYDLDTYAAGSDLTTKLFVEDAAYRQQAQTAIAAAMSDASIVSLLRVYKAAEKTEQASTTSYEQRRVPDVCYDWYYGSYACTATRSVPVERCVPAYPDGIVSPLTAFGRADGAFRELWIGKSDANARAAENKRIDHEITRSQIGPRLMLALQIVAGFLVVMFFFLIIAIERRLRKLSIHGVEKDPSEAAAAPAE
jgi:hypothetical protein